MKIYAADDRELMEISQFVREGDALLLRGKIFGTMPVTAKLTAREARAAFKQLDWKTLLFAVSLFFRGS